MQIKEQRTVWESERWQEWEDELERFGSESCMRREEEEEGNGQETDCQDTVEEEEVMKRGIWRSRVVWREAWKPRVTDVFCYGHTRTCTNAHAHTLWVNLNFIHTNPFFPSGSCVCVYVCLWSLLFVWFTSLSPKALLYGHSSLLHHSLSLAHLLQVSLDRLGNRHQRKSTWGSIKKDMKWTVNHIEATGDFQDWYTKE